MKIRVLMLIFALLIITIAGCNSQFISSGIIYMQQNDMDKAIQQFQLAIENEPNNPQAYLWLGKAYGEKKDYEKASSYFIQALEKDTTSKVLDEMKNNYEFFWAILFNAGIGFRKNNDSKERFNDYEKWLLTAEQVKDTFLNYDYLVLLYGNVGNEKEMLKSYNKSITKFPENLTVIFNVAKYYINNEQYDIAKDFLEKAKSIDPKNPNITFYLASIYKEIGKKDKAIEEFKKMEKIYNEMDDKKKAKFKGIYKESLYEVGLLYTAKKNYKNAIIFYDKAYQIDNTDLGVIKQLAYAYYLAKNFSKAIDMINVYFETGGEEESQLYLVKSDCLNRIGKKNKALETYKKYEELKKKGK